MIRYLDNINSKSDKDYNSVRERRRRTHQFSFFGVSRGGQLLPLANRIVNLHSNLIS